MGDRVSKPRRPARRHSFAGARLAAAIAASAPPASAENVFLSIEHRLGYLEGSIAPELYGTSLLFAHRPQRATRYVALRLRDDPTLHVYGRQVREAGTPQAFTLFILTLDLSSLPLPADGRLYYRMAVDGAWMADPANPAREGDASTGLEWSFVQVDRESVQPPRSPQWLDGGVARFEYRGSAGLRVALIGDFNRWDPYMHTLAETEPGRYSIELRLPPGPHVYAFAVNGVWTEDPLNPESAFDRQGRMVSVATTEAPGGKDAPRVAARGTGAATH